MSGELNGTYTVVTDEVGEIVGGGDLTVTYGGSPIEIGNKSSGDNIVYLDGELSGKQLIFSGPFTYNNDAQYRRMRADALSGTQRQLTLTYVGSGTVTDESFAAAFVPTGLSDAIPQGAKIETTISFNSSGAITHVEAADV